MNTYRKSYGILKDVKVNLYKTEDWKSDQAYTEPSTLYL